MSQSPITQVSPDGVSQSVIMVSESKFNIGTKPEESKSTPSKKIFPSQRPIRPLHSQTQNLRCKQVKNPQVIQEQRNVHHHVHFSHFFFVVHGELER